MGWESETFRLRSFEYEKGGLSMEVREFRLRGVGGVQELEKESGMDKVELWRQVEDLDAWKELELVGTVDVLSALEGEAYVQVVCERTRFEQADQLQMVNDKGSFTLVIPLGDLRGDMGIRPVLVTSGTVGEMGTVVSSGNWQQFQVDPPEEFPGGGLNTEWSAEFFEDKNISDALSFLDYTPGSKPTLYLNLGVQDMYELLRSRRSSGLEARVRQLLLDQIEIDTWFALGRGVVPMGYRYDQEERECELIEPDYESMWEGKILMKLATLCGESSDPEGMKTMAERFYNPEDHEFVRSRLQSGVSKMGLGKRVENLTEEVGKKKGN